MSTTRLRLSLLLTIALMVSMATVGAPPSQATHGGLHVTDLSASGLSANDLAQRLISADDVQIDPATVVFTGNPRGGGTFSGGDGIIGFEDGIILTSGYAIDVVGPNISDRTGRNLSVPGDAALSAIVGTTTLDASILEFDFTAPADAEQVFFTYVFGSEEYNEFVGSAFNDVFAFWVNGVNCAVVGENDDPVSVNTINHGKQANSFSQNPGAFDPVNPELYINNDRFHGHFASIPRTPGAPFLNTEMDGLTVPLTCVADVEPGTNTMRMAIADTVDRTWDSWVLIQAGSLTTTPPDPDAECVDLIAAQHEVAGEVCVDNDGDDLTVTYTTRDGWEMTETHLHVADDAAGVPQNRRGNPQVGRFDHAGTHDPATTQVVYTISLADLDAAAGDVLTIAAHAVVQRDEGGDELRVESAWGDGDRFVEQGSWATHFTYTVR